MTQSAHGRPPGPETDPDSGEGRLVRSYMVTGGRTRAGAADLPMEALVVLTPSGHTVRGLMFEKATIASLCQEVLSVAEVAAHAHLPLGVTRVLLSDMRDEGLIEVHLPAPATTRVDAALLERVLDGLRAV